MGLIMPYAIAGALQEHTSALSLLLLLSLIQLFPLFMGLALGRVNMLAFIFLSHFLNNTLGMFKDVSHAGLIGNISTELIPEVTQYIYCDLITIFCFFFAYALLVPSIKGSSYEPWDLSFWEIVIIAALSLALPALNVGDSIGSYVSLARIFLPAILFSSESSKHPKALIAGRFAVLLSTIEVFVLTQTLTYMWAVGFLILTNLLLRRKLSFAFLVVPMALVLFLIQPVKGFLRTILRSDGISFEESIGFTLDVIRSTYLSDAAAMERVSEFAISHGIIDANSDSGLTTTVQSLNFDSESEGTNRPHDLDLLLSGYDRARDDSLGRVLAMTPSQVPYWEGSTYSHLLYMAIPRFLWPDKPLWLDWARFGHLYNYLNEDDDATSIGFSYLAEGYMNFGYPGLYWTAIFFGIFVAFSEYFCSIPFGWANATCFVCASYTLLNWGADFSSMITTSVLGFLLMFSMRFFFPQQVHKNSNT